MAALFSLTIRENRNGEVVTTIKQQNGSGVHVITEGEGDRLKIDAEVTNIPRSTYSYDSGDVYKKRGY